MEKQARYYQVPDYDYAPKQRTRTKKAQAKKKMFFLGVRIVLTVVLLCFLCLFEQVRIAKVNYQMIENQKTLQQLAVENERLQVKIVELESMQRIEQVAKNKLGMIKPADIQWVTLNN